jgi:hypothetical protein
MSKVQLLVLRQSQLSLHLSLNIIAGFIILHINLSSMIVAVSCMQYTVPTGSIWKVPFGGFSTFNWNRISRSSEVFRVPKIIGEGDF